MKHSVVSSLKTSACASLFKTPCLTLEQNAVYFQPKPTLLGPLITFVNIIQTLF